MVLKVVMARTDMDHLEAPSREDMVVITSLAHQEDPNKVEDTVQTDLVMKKDMALQTREGSRMAALRKVVILTQP